MQKLKVTIKEKFVSPFFWNQFNGKQYILDAEDRVINDKTIIIENDPNTKVIIFGSWTPYAYDYDKYLEYKKQKELDRQKAIAEQKLFYETLQKEAIEFNTSLNIPVKWSSKIKENLSGLSMNSWGNGQKKNTVRHIYLLEEINFGKLKRQKHSFLCSPVKAKYHGNWSGTLETFEFDRKVDCKSCLKTAQRFKKQQNKTK
jgi:hypothetical protein